MPRLSMFFIVAVALASLCAVSGSRHFSPIQLPQNERFHSMRPLNDVVPNTAIFKPFLQMKPKVASNTALFEEPEPSEHQAFKNVPNIALFEPIHKTKPTKTTSFEESESSDRQAPKKVPNIALFEPFHKMKPTVASKTVSFEEPEHSDRQAHKKVPNIPLFEPFLKMKPTVASKTVSFEEPEHSDRQAYKKVVSDINMHGENQHESLRPSQVNKYEWQKKKSLGTAKAIVARMIAMYRHSP